MPNLVKEFGVEVDFLWGGPKSPPPPGNCSWFPQIRNHFFKYSLLFSDNNLLFYPLFYMKIEICFLYKGLSYSREPTVELKITPGKIGLKCVFFL